VFRPQRFHAPGNVAELRHSERVSRDSAWIEEAEAGIFVRARAGSYAARRAASVLDEAVRSRDELETLLDPPAATAPEPITIYLLDGLSAPAEESHLQRRAGRDGTIVQKVRPEAPGVPVTWPLTRVLVELWFGSNVTSSTVILDGIAGVVADRIEAGPSVRDADTTLRRLLEEGRTPTLFAAAGSQEVAANNGRGITEQQLLATSFVAFLLKSHGEEALREFLHACERERRDAAAIAAYDEPLAALEEGWIAAAVPEVQGKGAFRRLVQQLLPLVRANLWRELELTGYTLLDAVFSVAIPLLTGLFINRMNAGDTGALLPYMLLLVGIFLLLTPISLRRAYASTVLSQSILFGLQQDVFARLLRLPHSFHARSNVGDLMTRMTGDVERVRGAIEAVLRSAAYVVVKGILAAAVLFWINPLLAALALLTVPLFWVGYLALRSRLELMSRRAQTLFGELGTTTHESLAAHAVIKAFGLEARTLAEYRSRMYGFFGTVRRLVTMGSALDASASFAMTVGQLVVLGVGGYMVSRGDLEIGFLVTFFGMLPAFFETSTALAGLRRTIVEASGSMERVLEVLEEPLVIDEKPNAAELGPVEREIRFEGVTFGYSAAPTLHDISLTIPAGSNVAVVGPSGSGKSTLINLLLRFWDPRAGRVVADGRDLRDVKLASLRGQIGLVFQDTFVFDTTLRENVAIARPGATDDEIESAVRNAQLAAYVESLPAGFETVVGERGVRMSGGQRQRLALARALVRDPRILILDEATSALDPETEAEVQETLSTLARGRTTIAITHRLASVADADHIFVLDGGRLVEEGTHDELMARGGLYQQLYEEQLAPGAPAARRAELQAARLRTVPLFADLDAHQLGALADRLRAERYAADDVLVRAGDPGETLFLLASGQADVIVQENSHERKLGTLNEGDAFGELALLTGEPWPVTVRAMSDVEVYTLARANFISFVERAPNVRAAIESSLRRLAPPAPDPEPRDT